MIDFKRNWDDQMSLVDFAYNNSYNLSIEMTPFEALFVRRCSLLV